MLDLIIIGSGPAGLSAAIYAQRARLHTLGLERHMLSGGQVLTTYEVDNYPGLPQLDGMALSEKFRAHADRLGARWETAEVRALENGGDVKRVICAHQTYEARAVILATGAVHRPLGAAGEQRLTGKGVSYCATCDGMFFRGKTVAVVGGGDVAVEDAIYLSRLCEKVLVIHRRDRLRAGRMLQEQLFAAPNVEILWNTTIRSIDGGERVEGVTVETDGETRALAVDGVFIAVGIQPNSEAFRGVVDTDESGFIRAGEDCVTSAAGIFAAGDVRTKPMRQIVTAVADGAVAVQAAEAYLGAAR